MTKTDFSARRSGHRSRKSAASSMEKRVINLHAASHFDPVALKKLEIVTQIPRLKPLYAEAINALIGLDGGTQHLLVEAVGAYVIGEVVVFSGIKYIDDLLRRLYRLIDEIWYGRK